jgi:hypothetical protein
LRLIGSIPLDGGGLDNSSDGEIRIITGRFWRFLSDYPIDGNKVASHSRSKKITLELVERLPRETRKLVCHMNFNRGLIIGAISGAILFSADGAHATGSYLLKDGNSSVLVEADGPFGMRDWCVDGVDNLWRQQFFYRIGSKHTDREYTINNLGLVCATATGNNALNLLYQNHKLSIEVDYVLTGGVGGSGYSTITEQIKISNLSDKPLDFHFFQFVDFDLLGSNLGESLYLNQNLMGLYDAAYQTKGGFYFADEFVSPGANRAQVEEVSTTWPMLDSLNDNGPTTLNNNIGPISGDVAWAFQWDKSIEVGGVFEISVIKSVYATPIPEPSALALISLGGLAVLVRRNRCRSNSPK